MRSAFSRGGGNLGESGCVAWNFDHLGVIGLEMKDEERGDELSLLAIDAGADDVRFEDEFLEIFTSIDQLQSVQLVYGRAKPWKRSPTRATGPAAGPSFWRS